MKKIIVLLIVTASLILVYGTFRYGIPGYAPVFPQGSWQTNGLLMVIVCSIVLTFAEVFKKKAV